jgi:hypothetical protein
MNFATNVDFCLWLFYLNAFLCKWLKTWTLNFLSRSTNATSNYSATRLPQYCSLFVLHSFPSWHICVQVSYKTCQAIYLSCKESLPTHSHTSTSVSKITIYWTPAETLRIIFKSPRIHLGHNEYHRFKKLFLRWPHVPTNSFVWMTNYILVCMMLTYLHSEDASINQILCITQTTVHRYRSDIVQGVSLAIGPKVFLITFEVIDVI